MKHLTLCNDTIGIKYGGKCPVCDSFVKPTEGVLYKTGDGQYIAVHADLCSGGKTKHAIRGGLKWRTSPDATLEVRA